MTTTARESGPEASGPARGDAGSRDDAPERGLAPSSGSRPEVHGRLLDAETRCAHWHGPLDIIAIRFPCCGKFYACHDCHAEHETHPPERWPRERFDTAAVLCGACGHVLTIREYLDSGHRCPACGRGFNPRCALHYGLYFEA
ncbi:MAG TPA: CHY zinc finger protein [Longimicrobiales bacterium]